MSEKTKQLSPFQGFDYFGHIYFGRDVEVREIACFDRALSPEEIKNLYEKGLESMPESMVERVARAMFERLRSNKNGHVGQYQEPRLNDDLEVSGHTTLIDGYFDLEEIARAAIAAMREPTEEQYNALCATNKMWREMNSEFVWQTYIDAAMKPAITVAEFHDTVITPFTNKLREP